MNESTDFLSGLFPYFLLLAAFGYFWMTRNDNDVDDQIRELNARLNVLDDEVENACGHYTSTACHHANDDDNEALHAQCRRQCKFCPRLCECECHEDENPQDFLHLLDDPRNGIPIKSTGLMADLKKWWSKR